MRTFKYLITLTVDDSDGELTSEEINAMFDHIRPASSVVEYGFEPHEHFFIESIVIDDLSDETTNKHTANGTA